MVGCEGRLGPLLPSIGRRLIAALQLAFHAVTVLLYTHCNVAPELGDVLTRDPIDDVTPLTLSHYHVSILSFSVNWTR